MAAILAAMIAGAIARNKCPGDSGVISFQTEHRPPLFFDSFQERIVRIPILALARGFDCLADGDGRVD